MVRLWEAPTSEASPPVHMHHHNMQVFKLIWTCFETQFDWLLDKKDRLTIWNASEEEVDALKEIQS